MSKEYPREQEEKYKNLDQKFKEYKLKFFGTMWEGEYVKTSEKVASPKERKKFQEMHDEVESAY